LPQNRHVGWRFSEGAPKEAEQLTTPVRSVDAIEMKDTNQPAALVCERGDSPVLIDTNVFAKRFACRVE